MTLTQLKIFAAVAESGHVTRAAAALGITQSAASAAIAALENLYEVKLFNRVGRSVELSEAGQIFLVEARAVLDRARLAHRTLRTLGGSATGHLDIAASQTIANYWLPRRLSVFHDRYPAIALNVVISNTRGVERAVVNGDADVGFVEGITHSPELLLDEVDHDQLALVVSAKRWPSLGVGGVDLAAVPWVVREPGSGTRGVLEDMALGAGLQWSDLNVVLELPSNEAVREAVEAGAGATLISRHVVASALSAGTLRALPLDVPPRSYKMVRHRKRHASPARRALVEMVLESVPSA
jgi:DNA-binding transcriptional LysR family regulator